MGFYCFIIWVFFTETNAKFTDYKNFNSHLMNASRQILLILNIRLIKWNPTPNYKYITKIYVVLIYFCLFSFSRER